MAEFKQKFESCFEKHLLWWVFGAALLAAAVNFGVFVYLTGGVFYTDTDCYTRALRIVDWLNDFQWAEKMFPFFNPPSGFVLHFTRICDVIWAVLAAPFMPFWPLKEAVFYGGFLFAPLFMGLALVAVFWGIKPYLADFKGKAAALLTVLAALLFYAIKLNDVFDAVRPDHHSLMCFVFSFNVAAVLRQWKMPREKDLFWAGVLSGVGIWASSAPEGFLVVAMVLGILAINRIFYEQPAQNMFWYALGVFLSVAAAWLINPPYGGHGVLDVERLSVVHVVLTAVMAAALNVVARLKLQKKVYRILALLGAAALTVGVMLAVFGVKIWLRPLFAPEVWEYCLKYTGEIQPLPLLSYETPNIVVTFLTLGGLFGLFGWRRHLVDLLILTLFCFAATVLFWRFYAYLMMMFLFLSALLLYELLYRARKSEKFKWAAFSYLVAPMLVLIAFYMQPQPQKMPSLKEAALVDVLEVPELVFNQDIDAIGGPYHPNVEGIRDNHLMWFATDEQVLKELMKKHNIRSVYLEPNVRPDYYVAPAENMDKFYGKVMTGKKMYDWLEKVGIGHYEVIDALF